MADGAFLGVAKCEFGVGLRVRTGEEDLLLLKVQLSGKKIMNADECVLEALINNYGALRLYGSLGFVRAKRLPKYYLNGLDAYRLKLYLKDPIHEYQKLISIRVHGQGSNKYDNVINNNVF